MVEQRETVEERAKDVAKPCFFLFSGSRWAEAVGGAVG